MDKLAITKLLLSRIGGHVANQGYPLFALAVVHAWEQPDCRITAMETYRWVAKEAGGNPTQVSRAIARVTEDIWLYGNLTPLARFYGSWRRSDKPTPKELIHLIAWYLCQRVSIHALREEGDNTPIV